MLIFRYTRVNTFVFSFLTCKITGCPWPPRFWIWIACGTALTTMDCCPPAIGIAVAWRTTDAAPSTEVVTTPVWPCCCGVINCTTCMPPPAVTICASVPGVVAVVAATVAVPLPLTMTPEFDCCCWRNSCRYDMKKLDTGEGVYEIEIEIKKWKQYDNKQS